MVMPKKPLETLIVKTEGCWTWRGSHTAEGYAMFRGRGAHRAVYERHVGPIPPGYEVDHTCCNAGCVNPDHLEAVTPEENRRRKYLRITQCVNGHDYTADNTYIRPATGNRDCRACIRDRVKRYRKKESAA